MWAYAREGSAKEQMRFCYEHIEEEIKLCTGLAERFSAEKMYEQFVELVQGSNDEQQVGVVIL